MPDKSNRKIILSQGGSFFQDLTLRLKLILRLMGDNRVNPLLKVLPIGSLVYFLVPDIAPGPIDDAAIIWLATYLFVELCPPGVVQEHLEALRATRKVMDSYQETSQSETGSGVHGEVIDGEIVESDSEGK
ncbi:MAG: hypothetical protein A2136_06590 [Chloroflexi bacterium RBG_16_54_11]|nr:MAG: hypothetical protein A2136_06590 [Chloroflexi bacterium RBG_16_54_11]